MQFRTLHHLVQSVIASVEALWLARSRAYLVTHGESSVVCGGTPHVGNETHVGKVYQIEPAVQDKPPSLPVRRREVGAGDAGKSEAVEEEEAEDDYNACENAPPQLLVHVSFDVLLPLHKVFHGEIQRVQGPDVKGREGRRQRKDDQQHERARVVWSNCKRCNGVHDTEDKVRHGEPPYDDHGLAQSVLHHTISHADDQEQEKGERVSEGIQDGDNNHKNLGAQVVAVAVLVIIETPGHKHFQDEKHEDGGDVVLHSEDVVPVLEVQKRPEAADDKVCDGDAAVEGQLGYLGGWQLSVGVAERDDGLVLDALGERHCGDAVVARLEGHFLGIVLVGVVDGLLLVEVDGFGADEVLGFCFVVVVEDPLCLVRLVADVGLYALVVADVGELQQGQRVRKGDGARRNGPLRPPACPGAASPSTPTR